MLLLIKIINTLALMLWLMHKRSSITIRILLRKCTPHLHPELTQMWDKYRILDRVNCRGVNSSVVEPSTHEWQVPGSIPGWSSFHPLPDSITITYNWCPSLDCDAATGVLALVRAQEDRWSLQDGVPYSAKWGMNDLSHLYQGLGV